jgi:hypothetical protein
MGTVPIWKQWLMVMAGVVLSPLFLLALACGLAGCPFVGFCSGILVRRAHQYLGNDPRVMWP